MYRMKRRVKRKRKIRGKGTPYVNKRNRLMLGKGKKQRGGFWMLPIITLQKHMAKQVPK